MGGNVQTGVELVLQIAIQCQWSQKASCGVLTYIQVEGYLDHACLALQLSQSSVSSNFHWDPLPIVESSHPVGPVVDSVLHPASVHKSIFMRKHCTHSIASALLTLLSMS